MKQAVWGFAAGVGLCVAVLYGYIALQHRPVEPVSVAWGKDRYIWLTPEGLKFQSDMPKNTTPLLAPEGAVLVYGNGMQVTIYPDSEAFSGIEPTGEGFIVGYRVPATTPEIDGFPKPATEGTYGPEVISNDGTYAPGPEKDTYAPTMTEGVTPGTDTITPPRTCKNVDGTTVPCQ